MKKGDIMKRRITITWNALADLLEKEKFIFTEDEKDTGEVIKEVTLTKGRELTLDLERTKK